MVFKYCRVKYEGEVSLADSSDSLGGILKYVATGLHELPHCYVGWNGRHLEVCLCLPISGDSVLDPGLTSQILHRLHWRLKPLDD